ncbi:PREDICTED: ATP-binding cassette sub-family A member 7 [Dipodomys ordii]|uniref:ATP-binding cassette sub-family A member 7 n=1 Tax=Dipodomys ordii TaxID=10020 RepID=A0A1S3FP60_DIPOR|nr:PREDICTED: ATP-binding cassette sub-family A member 7 [Dipodomys ordii]
MAFWTQLMLLLWKNFMYRRRQPIQLLVELLWPLFLFFILVAVRHSHPPLEHHECHFPNKPLPSAGTLPWLQGLICNVNNSCFSRLTPGEKPGLLSNFKDSLISRLLADAHTVLGSPNAHRTLTALGKLMPLLKSAGNKTWPQHSDPLQEQPSLATEFLGMLSQGESLLAALGQTQETVSGFVEAAENLTQELLALPSLVELRALLRRPQGTRSPLQLVSEAFCSAKGPSSPGGLSLNWYEASQIKELVGPEPASPLMVDGLSPDCSKLMGALDDHPLSHLLWRRLKPLIHGKILFAPDTNFTRQLMAQMNRTFEELALLRDVKEVWGALGPQVFDFMNNSDNMAMLQRLLELQNKGQRRPGSGGLDRTEAIRSFLDPSRGGYSWRDAHADVGRLVGSLGRVMECVSLDKLEAAPSEAALVSRALQLLAERRLWAGIVFLGPEDSQNSTEMPAPGLGPGHVRVKIRMDIDDVTRTNKIMDKFWDPGPSADPLMDLRYVWGGFVYLQDLLERAAVRVLSGTRPRVGLYLQQMPYPCYVDDVFLRVLSRSLPLFLTLSWIYSVALTVKAVVREKETRLRDTMRAMGLSRAVLWLGWFLSCLGPFLLSAALLVMVLKLGDILPYSHPVVIFLFLATFSVATVVQSFLLSAFFSHANLAAACGGLIYFSLYLPYVLCVAWREQLPTAGRVAASLLSPVAFGFGCESLALLEEQGEGAQWYNLGIGPAGDVFSLAQVSGLLLLDAVLYGLVLWYLEAVCPGQYGIPEPWNFPFQRSYWCGPGAPKGPAPAPAPQDPKGSSQLLALVQRVVPGAQLVEELPRELVLSLPYAGALDGSFASLFQELDQGLAALGLTGYGISDTSLEEIFLKVVEDCAVDADQEDGSSGQHLSTRIAALRRKTLPETSALENGEPAGPCPQSQALRGCGTVAAGRACGAALIHRQLWALLLKRFLLACRSRRGLFAQIVLPALFVGLALVFSLIVPPFGHYPALRLSPDMYGAQVSFFSEDAPWDPVQARLLEALLREAGLDGPCLQNTSTREPEHTQHPACRFSVPKVPADVAQALARGNWTLDFPSPACQCSQPGVRRRLLPDCPAGAGGPPPPQAMASSGEVVQNLTGRNVSDFLVKTYPRLVHEGLKTKKWVNEVRYGGFSLGSRDLDLPTGHEVGHTVELLQSLLTPQAGGALDRILNNLTKWADGLDGQKNFKIWFNNKGWHAMVAFINRANNALLQAHLPPGPARRAHSITTLNHPLNLTKEQLSEAALMASSVDVLVSICVVFAMSFVPASFTLVLIEERVTRAKHLQLLGGLSPTLYWLSNFLWDMCNYLVAVCIVVLIFLAFQQKAYVAPANLPALLLLLLLYGWSITPLMYPASFFFSVPSTAYVVLTCINLFIGINSSMATFVLELFSDQKLQEVSRILKRVFLIFPHFCLGRGLIDMVRNQAMADAFERLGENLVLGGACFGLLGVNGAGKTSTFRMVTGDTLPSRGEAVLAGHSVAKEPAEAHRRMGYCPQSDAIFDLLTGREHLEFFARLHGVPEAQVAQIASLGLARLGLPRYADRPAGTYSGGNKRKLATAIALVGDPAVVFLDEPTTGMDPSARRFLWNSLLAVVREGHSVVLTSHSMEECEALCTRLAIMVNGRFRCLGSAQHLKSRFGSGHTLTLRVPADQPERAAAFVAAAFPGAELREVHGGRLRFQLPPGGRCALAHVFGELAAHGADHGVEDFSVSQTTLEEVFLYFSKDQGKDEDEDHQPEAEGETDTQPGPLRPKRINRFLEDPSMVETML